MAEFKVKLKTSGRLKENLRSYYTVKYEDEEYLVPMLKYQVDRGGIPEELHCLVKKEGGGVRITQDFAHVVSELYCVGHTYKFKVRRRDDGYLAQDANGLLFKLNVEAAPGGRLDDGLSVTARVRSIERNRVQLDYVAHTVKSDVVPFTTLEQLAAAMELDPDDAAAWQRMMQRENAFESVRSMYAVKDGLWVLETATVLDGLLLGNEGGLGDEGPSAVRIFNRLCLHLLEESSLLSHMPQEERSRNLNTLTLIAGHAQDYVTAYKILSDGTEQQYVSRQLRNLAESENLYQPESKFRIMMCLFNLREEMMEEMMDKIFDTIENGRKNNWRTEPFRTAFVNMLELFINEYRHKAVRAQGPGLIHKMIRAIAIQQLLSNADDDIDRRLNRATFYRLLSYLQRSGERLLDYAFDTLFKPLPEETGYDWDDVSNLENLFYKASYPARVALPAMKGRQRHRFHGGTVDLVVDGDSVRLEPPAGRSMPVDISNILDWRGIEIRSSVEIRARLRNRSKAESVAAYWREVNRDLLSQPTRGVSASSRKILPSEGEFVHVRIEDVDRTGTAVFCQVVDDVYSGEGWLDLREVVKFFKPTDGNDDLMNYFRGPDGADALFEVLVKEISNGCLEFSMLDVVDDYFSATLQPGDLLDINVRSLERDPMGDYYLGFSRSGASCRIMVMPGMPAIDRNSIVRAHFCNFTGTGQLVCEYAGPGASYFNAPTAFRNLMLNLAEDPADTTAAEPVNDEEMDPEVLREIIGILDRQAAITENKVRSLSLLNLAGLLCTMAGDSEGADYYEKRKSIVLAFEDYEINGFSNDSKCRRIIEQSGDEFRQSDFLLSEAFTKFRLLDALNNRRDLTDLYEIRENAANGSVRNAADLAIAGLLLSRFELPNVQRLINDRLNTELGVKVRASKLKDYGVEDQTKEFKTSIIYPAGREHRMRPAAEMQGAKIMRTVCGFLNSDKGGTLYLGVNDAGAACGLAQDMTYLNANEDKYERYVHSMVRHTLGVVASQCVQTRWEEDGGYRILVLRIAPAPEFTSLHGEYWQRQGSETVFVAPDKVEQLAAMKVASYARYLASTPGAKAPSAETAPKDTPQAAPAPGPTAPAATPRQQPEKRTDKIDTCAWRHNKVVDYEDDYGVGTLAYLHFFPDNTFKVTDEGIYEPTLLSLAIQEEEAGGHLLVGYDTGKMLIVPMTEILNRTRNQKGARCRTATPLFVAPLPAGCEVMSVWENARGERQVRIDSAETIIEAHGEGSLTDEGVLLPSARFNRVLRYEIVPAKHLGSFQKMRHQGGNLGQSPTLQDIKEFDAKLSLSL